ncbi:MAG: hypothetical protein H8K10_15205 [Nitrospira sp.]|nr:hypothetical protein [Nitrospira sp.]
MLEKPLRLLEAIFPSSAADVSPDTWNTNLPTICEQLAHVGGELLGIAKLSLPKRLFSESKQELIANRTPMIQVCKLRLCPQTNYYQSTRQPIPSPENHSGPEATGIELNLSFCRGYAARGVVRLPWFSIQFSVWGSRERAAFMELLRDHRRSVEKLLLAPGLDFTTSCVFENVNKYEGSGVFKKLELYFRNAEDPENTFTLGKSFGPKTGTSDLVTTLLPLMALYDLCFGYCRSKKDKDRILDFGALMRHEI